jgi:hypothetical protein
MIPYKFLFHSHGFTIPPNVDNMDLDPATLTTIILAAFEAAESPLPQLLMHRQRRMHYLATLLCGPTRVVKDYTPKRCIAYHLWATDIRSCMIVIFAPLRDHM